MLDTYSKNKAKIVSWLTELVKIAGSDHVKTAAQSILTKLESNIFSLVVVGQFKRGKTTFINALLGKELLPVGIIPLTSIITVLNYGEDLRINAFFDNDASKEISLDDLPLYITEKHNPKNKKGVDRVEIAYPSPYLKNGVQIIDTPGVASVHEHNTKTTYEYLPRADAAIFLVSVDPPLTQAELHFLRDLKKLVTKTFFIQNKIDTVNKADCEESLAFSKDVIEKEAGFNNAEIYPLSAKNALDGKIAHDQEKIEQSGLVGFERSLDRFLMEEKGQVLLNSAINKTENLISEELLLAELEEKSIRLPLGELEEKIEKFKTFIRDVNQEKIDSNRLLAEEIKALQADTLAEDLEKLKQEKTKWLVSEVEKITALHQADGNRQFAEAIDGFIDMQIRDIFGRWRIEEEKSLKGRLADILKRFVGRMNSILGQIVQSASKLFGVSHRQFQMQEALPPEIEFRFKTTDESDMLGITLDFAKKALPKALAHRLILKEAREKAEMMIDRHCGKTRYDLSRRMEKLVQNYRDEITRTVESAESDVLKALEIGIASKNDTAIEVSTRESHLHDKIKKLKEIRESSQNLKV